MKDIKKPKDWKITKWLKEKGKRHLADALQLIGNTTSVPVISNIIKGIGDTLENDQEITPAELEEFKRLADLDIKEMEEISNRWLSDNEQELKLPKLIRPSILAYSWVLLTLLIVLDAFGITVDSIYIKTFEILALTVNGAYFGARTIEKYSKIKYNEKN